MKKFLLRVIKIIILVAVLLGYGYDNIKSYSVYYAKNTPHKEGVEPVFMMVLDNLWWIYTPDIEGLGYDFDGVDAILTFDKKGRQLGFITTLESDGEYEYLFANENLMFHFNRELKLISVADISDDYKDIDIRAFDQAAFKNDIYKIIKPLIDMQGKPLINLQWLFDIVYQDEFN